MTKKQSRIMIAKAIEIAIIALGVVGLLLTVSAFAVLRDALNPIILGFVEYFTGIGLMAFSLYAKYKIYYS